jgi:hypothetical protein
MPITSGRATPVRPEDVGGAAVQQGVVDRRQHRPHSPQASTPASRYRRSTDVCPRVTLAGSAGSVLVRCRFHTCRPVYRGFSRIVVNARRLRAACALSWDCLPIHGLARRAGSR